MRRSSLERRLVVGVLALFLVPSVVAVGVLVGLYYRGALRDPSAMLLAVLVGLTAMMLYLGVVAHTIGRTLVATLREIQRGTELMATVNPDHRHRVSTGDELESVAEEINRMADGIREARRSLEARVAHATGELGEERAKLTAVLAELDEGVLVATLEGRITLANPAAQRLLGAPRGGLLGRSLWDFADREAIVSALERLRGGERAAEHFALRAGGAVRRAAMTRFLDDGQRLGGFILGLREDNPHPAPTLEAPVVAAPRFVGAGLTSGVAGDERDDERFALYDFSFLDEAQQALVPEDRERALSDLTFVVLDTETTGLHLERGDCVVSLAGVKVRGGAVRRRETFDALVSPGRSIPPASTRFHGITDAMVADAPSIGVVLPAFLRFCEGAVLAGHDIWFDLAMLRAGAERVRLVSSFAGRVALDTRLLSQFIHGIDLGHDLERVAERLGAPVQGRHSALGDALTAAEVLVRLLPLLERRGVLTLGAAVEAERLAGARARPRGAP